MTITSNIKPKFWNFLFYSVIVVCFLFIFRDFISERVLRKNSKEIDFVLNLAGPNRAELENVLNHYKANGDNQKLEASELLISQCYIYSNSITTVFDTTGQPICFNPTNYGTEKRHTVAQIKDSFLLANNVIREINYDCRTLSAEYLINHIDRSFETWDESPWKDRIDFEQFCKYILPYRVGNEPLSEWHELLSEKYGSLIDTLSERTILNSCRTINDALAQDIRYDRRWIKGGLGVQSIPQLMASRSGMCDDLVVYGACAMRACGIPVSVDFDIHGRTNFGHSWCVVFDEKGKAWSFGPGEQNPVEHKLEVHKFPYRIPAKVFRKNFFNIDNNNSIPELDLTNIPPLFTSFNVRDVTSEYVKTLDVDIQVDRLQANHEYLYICVFNNKEWRPVHWAKWHKGHAIFTDMGAGIVYLVGYYHNNKIIPITEPFILNKNGIKTYLSGSGNKVRKINYKQLWPRYTELSDGDIFQLFVWKEGEWEYNRSMTVTGDSLFFEGFDDNTLYIFQDRNRPFTVMDTTVTFW